MSKVTAPFAATVAPVTRDTTVGTLINEAGQAAASMLQKCKEAAAAAAPQLDAKLKMSERIESVMALYVVDFTAAGHNVKALFKDALTLHAAGQTPVLVSVIGKDGKKQDETCTALEAVEASKHNMRDAAKQVRELNGMSRASGGGRKPAVTAGLPAAPDMTVKLSDIDAFTAWLDNLPEYLSDTVYHGKIVARLIENGYSITKAAKGRIIKGAASA